MAVQGTRGRENRTKAGPGFQKGAAHQRFSPARAEPGAEQGGQGQLSLLRVLQDMATPQEEEEEVCEGPRIPLLREAPSAPRLPGAPSAARVPTLLRSLPRSSKACPARVSLATGSPWNSNPIWHRGSRPEISSSSSRSCALHSGTARGEQTRELPEPFRGHTGRLTGRREAQGGFSGYWGSQGAGPFSAESQGNHRSGRNRREPCRTPRTEELRAAPFEQQE